MSDSIIEALKTIGRLIGAFTVLILIFVPPIISIVSIELLGDLAALLVIPNFLACGFTFVYLMEVY